MDIKRHGELLKELQREHPTAVLDGAVNNDQWSSQKDKRILWILREVNDFAGDLRNLLNDPNELCKYSRWQATYGLIAKASYALLNDKWIEDADSLVKNEKILQKIAVINVNKTGGTATSEAQKLAEAAERFHEVIFRQVEFLDPDIVILGGVGDVLSNWLPKNDTKRQWIAVDHPGQRKLTHRQYYDLIVKKLKV
jgi:hypothetical protein